MLPRDAPLCLLSRPSELNATIGAISAGCCGDRPAAARSTTATGAPGATAGVIAEDGASVVRDSYGPYGEPNAWTGSGGAMLSRFRYTGQIALAHESLTIWCRNNTACAPQDR